MSLPSLAEALDNLLTRIDPVEAGKVDPASTPPGGRVLAEAVQLDRDSPACDVSAMDGFAVRAAEVTAAAAPVVGECRICEAPATLPENAALRIYTGSPLPAGADAVLQIERAEETGGGVRLASGEILEPGTHIRRRGENAAAGEIVAEAGQLLTPAAITTVASVGATPLRLRRRLRVAILTTGDEVEPNPFSGAALPAWRLRDSNGPTLEAMLGALPWVADVSRTHVADSREALAEALGQATAQADAVVLTGGVSKGAYDYVRDVTEQLGGDVVFHRLRVRPGKPALAALRDGVPIIGLPGNPVSVLCTAGRIVVPALRRRGGLAGSDPPMPTVRLTEWRGKSIDLTWWRPVRLVAAGLAELSPLRGSGDVCGAAASDGFVETPPGSDDAGPYAFYAWPT